MMGRLRRVAYVALLVTLAALAAAGGVSGASSTSFQQNVRPGYACGALNASGIGVYATEKAAGYGRAAAEDADRPAACRVEFSLRVPAVKPTVTFTGTVLRDMFTLAVPSEN
jgi:hypothetical protein